MKDAYYFPHFCNARHDRKIRRMIKELGIEGYGIFFMLLEVLREQIDYKYPLADLDLLSDEFGTSEQKIRVVVCNYKLFEVDEEEKFFSPKLIVYLQPYLNMKEQRRLAGKASGMARKAKKLNDRSTVVERMPNGDEQSKVNKSKVNNNSGFQDYQLELASEIAKKFSVRILTTNPKYAHLLNAILNIDISGNFDLLKKQFYAYREFKSIDNSRLHSIDNFIGTSEEDFTDGEWYKTDWESKLNEIDDESGYEIIRN